MHTNLLFLSNDCCVWSVTLYYRLVSYTIFLRFSNYFFSINIIIYKSIFNNITSIDNIFVSCWFVYIILLTQSCLYLCGWYNTQINRFTIDTCFLSYKKTLLVKFLKIYSVKFKKTRLSKDIQFLSKSQNQWFIMFLPITRNFNHACRFSGREVAIKWATVAKWIAMRSENRI